MTVARRRPVVGWDIGGANLKAARIADDGRVLAVEAERCPLWQGLAQLDLAFDAIEMRLGVPHDARHVLTMTGELVDCFDSRRAGCHAIVERVAGRRWGDDAGWFAGDDGILDGAQAISRWQQVASANWRASATWLARHVPAAVLVDLGSTTADVIAVREGRLRVTGRDDGSRLASDELVYTGLTRTPLMALAERAPFGGQSVGLMAEYFATTADVFRVLGQLDERCDLHPPADGGAKTPQASARRLARMVGRDLEEAPWTEWQALAAWFAERQRARLAAAITRVIEVQALPAHAPMVIAGIGRRVLAEVARELGRDVVPFHATLLQRPSEPGLAVAVDEQAAAVTVALAGLEPMRLAASSGA